MGIKYQVPAWIQRLYAGAMWRGDTTRKVVYLTFDDGPIPSVTPKLLDILEQEKVHATFFMVADNVTKHPEIYHRVVANGHKVGNHTYHHIKGTKYKFDDTDFKMIKGKTQINGNYDEFIVDDDDLYKTIIETFYKKIDYLD